jgi:ubiquinone/menaquinone biosynthesis C-methylase UbiE
LIGTIVTRDYLLKKIEWHQFDQEKGQMLEIGCGTGALLAELRKKITLNKWNVTLSGIDNNKQRIDSATKLLQKSYSDVKIQCMDIISNDFQDNSYDIIVTNYLFLWVKDIQKLFHEIHRILKPDGHLIILSEPDYGGLIEFPDSGLKSLLISNLIMNCADPEIARRIPQMCMNKFQIIEMFTSSIPWIAQNNLDNLSKELIFFKEVYEETLSFMRNNNEKRNKIEKNTTENFNTKNFKFEIIESALKNQQYFLFIPIFSFFLKNNKTKLRT